MPSKLLFKTQTSLSRYLVIAMLFFSGQAFSWDATGHRIIAAIAYSHLMPHVRNTVDYLTAIDDKGYSPLSRFLYLATVPDSWRQADGGQSAAWHYLNIPWSTDGFPITPATSPNLISVMQESENTLMSTHATDKQKVTALAYVLHLTGDAHQPLHCINRFSAQFPTGDRGGNLFPIKDNRVDNLHAYWDQGALWLTPASWRYPLTNKNVQRLARQLQQRFPADFFAAKVQDLQVSDWTRECYNIARETVYQLTPNARPSLQYRERAATIVGEQLTLAGYRLGNLLNQLLASKS